MTLPVYHSLLAVRGLQRGRTEARETEPVRPVDEALIEAVNPLVSRQVRDTIDVQPFTGCRPDEVVRLRPVDFQRGGPIWVVTLTGHKTAWHGIERAVYFGPKAQKVIGRYFLDRPLDACPFSPAEAETGRLADLHAARTTPLSCGNRPGTNRSVEPERHARDRYDVASYRRAIHRAC